MLASLLLALGLALADDPTGAPGGAPDPSSHTLVPPVVPNVLVIVLDDVGETGFAPYTSTPTIAGLAASGVTLRRFYTWPLCSPTRYAFTYGRLPRREGIGQVIDGTTSPVPRWLVSLPEALGHEVESCTVGKWHLGGSPRELAALRVFDYQRAGHYESMGTGGQTQYHWTRLDDGLSSASIEYASLAQADAAIEWIGTRAGRWLLVLNFSAAHLPNETPPGFQGGGGFRTKYVRAVEHLDLLVADVLGVVDLDTTAVFVTSDNGTPDTCKPSGYPGARSPDAPLGQSKGTTFEGGVNVPLYVTGCGIEAAVSDRLVSATDLAATVLELMDAPRPGCGLEDSRSFADELGAWTGDAARSWVFTEAWKPGYDDQAVVEARWKYRLVDPDGAGQLGTIAQVYDLVNDPTEAQPIAPENAPPEDLARLLLELGTLPPRP